MPNFSVESYWRHRGHDAFDESNSIGSARPACLIACLTLTASVASAVRFEVRVRWTSVLRRIISRQHLACSGVASTPCALVRQKHLWGDRRGGPLPMPRVPRVGRTTGTDRGTAVGCCNGINYKLPCHAALSSPHREALNEVHSCDKVSDVARGHHCWERRFPRHVRS